ncbi:ISPpu13, transposase Orf3 [Pseudomonas cannabina]|nr:ISPpu13, transposase Orf3 [Pseudomonas cannabina]
MTMQYDDKSIEDTVLALLAAYSDDNGNTWKGFDFEIMSRLHEHGFISDPVNRNKSVWLTDEGLEGGRQIAERLFGGRTDAQSESP